VQASQRFSIGGLQVDRESGATLDVGISDLTMLPSSSLSPRPVGQVSLAGGTIGLLSLLLCVGLSLLGINARMNTALQGLVADQGIGHTLPLWTIWLGVLVFAFGIPWILLHIPQAWRRLAVWLTMVVVIGGWVPVLGLAAYAPDLAAPIVAAVWSGICAMIYSANHRMPCDSLQTSDSHEAR
jgi:hypothetical protein